MLHARCGIVANAFAVAAATRAICVALVTSPGRSRERLRRPVCHFQWTDWLVEPSNFANLAESCGREQEDRWTYVYPRVEARVDRVPQIPPRDSRSTIATFMPN